MSSIGIFVDQENPTSAIPASTPRLVDRHVVAVRIADHEHTHQRTVIRMRSLFNHATHRLCPFPGRVEIVHHKPQQEPVPNAALPRISKRRPMVVASRTRRAPAMQTQQDRGVLVDNLIEDRRARMSVASIEQLLVPGAALRYVRNRYDRPAALRRLSPSTQSRGSSEPVPEALCIRVNPVVKPLTRKFSRDHIYFPRTACKHLP